MAPHPGPATSRLRLIDAVRGPAAMVPTVMFFWDYDTQWGADRSRLPRTRDWGHLEFTNTEELIDVHAAFGLHACFAVVGAAALPGTRPYHDPKQIRRIHGAGHEIASHAFTHEWLPGLDRQALRRTLRDSKDALEQCIGAPVVSFVPPFNQPFDYLRGWSISLAERREAWRSRTTLEMLCEALSEAGYRFCRVAYAPLSERLGAWLRVAAFRPCPAIDIAGITCVRISSCGFDPDVVRGLHRRSAPRGIVGLYGHPHSIHLSGTSQSIAAFRASLAIVSEWVAAGQAVCRLPMDLLRDGPAGAAGEARAATSGAWS